MPGTNAGGPTSRASHASDGASRAQSSRSNSTNPRPSPRSPSTRRSSWPSVTTTHRWPCVSDGAVASRESACGAAIRHDDKAHRIGTRGDQREQQASAQSTSGPDTVRATRATGRSGRDGNRQDMRRMTRRAQSVLPTGARSARYADADAHGGDVVSRVRAGADTPPTAMARTAPSSRQPTSKARTATAAGAPAVSSSSVQPLAGAARSRQRRRHAPRRRCVRCGARRASLASGPRPAPVPAARVSAGRARAREAPW